MEYLTTLHILLQDRRRKSGPIDQRETRRRDAGTSRRLYTGRKVLNFCLEARC
jgi:hypothetical protein